MIDFEEVVTCEVIDLQSSSTTCQNLPDFPVFIAIGGLGLKENPIICGGFQSGTIPNSCSSLENNEWVSSYSMNEARRFAAATQLQDGKLLVTGGLTGPYPAFSLDSVEILTEDGWQSTTPSLPVTIAGHCMVTVNSTTVMVIGGLQNSTEISGKTFYYTFGEESWSEGPELKYKREFHSCGRIRRDKDSQEMSIIVAGGMLDDESFLSSVEILDEGSSEWRTGPELPFAIGYLQLIEDQNGRVVLVGGAAETKLPLDALYQLPHAGLDATWVKIEQRLTTGRGAHTAFLIPNNIVDCS
jgi:N-acetylneuraminic acid mutarotase